MIVLWKVLTESYNLSYKKRIILPRIISIFFGLSPCHVFYCLIQSSKWNSCYSHRMSERETGGSSEAADRLSTEPGHHLIGMYMN